MPPPQDLPRERKKQVDGLVQPSDSPAAALTSLYFISGNRQHLPAATACPPVLAAPHKHFTEFLVTKEAWASLHSLNLCLGEELIVVRKQLRFVSARIARHTCRTGELSSYILGMQGGGCPQHRQTKYLSRTFSSMVFLCFSQLIQRVLSAFLHRRQPRLCRLLAPKLGWSTETGE